MKAVAWFAAAVILTVVALGLLLAIPFKSPADRTAIEASGAVAIIVQIFAFTIARLTAPSNYLAGWITGIALRFVTLIAFAFISVKGLGMPAPAALISLATFLFVSTLLEPKFLTL